MNAESASPGHRRIRVIGVGNPLRSDDGAGIDVIDQLRRRPLPAGVELIDGGTDGAGLLCWFEDADEVILVDAVRMGTDPGTVRVLDPARLLRPDRRGDGGPVGSHWTNLLDVVDAADRLGLRPRVALVAIEPDSVDPGERRTEPVQRAVETAAQRIASLVGDPPDSIRTDLTHDGSGADRAAPTE